MRITRYSPRMKIGNTTYTFGKRGISRSTKIGKHIRIGTTATGRRYISSRFLFWRIYQDLDELNYNFSHENLKNQKSFGNGAGQQQKRKQQIDYVRNLRANELSLWLFLVHPLVFFEHLFNKRNPQKNQQILQNYQNQVQSNQTVMPFQKTQQENVLFQVEIFKDYSGSIKKVTNGNLTLKTDRMEIVANVTKEIYYKDITDVYIEGGLIYVSSRGRNTALILKTVNMRDFMYKIVEKMKSTGSKKI